MSNTVENYLFLGLPKSGKTTYFSLMAQHLQHVANRTKFLEFRYLPTVRVNKETNEETYDEFTEVFIEDDFTEDFIEDCIARIKKQRWPRKTEGYETGYSFELHKSFSIFGRPILQKYFYSKAVIDYHDYPGEAFEVAFGVGGAPSPDMKKTAEDMKSRIKTARGLFLILDADALFNGQDNKKYRTTLTRLFRCIRDSNPYVKLAIIFNKLELFYGIEHDFVYKFREDYSNAYSWLPHNHKFFNVYPLGSVDTDENGATIPPKKLRPRKILDPEKWMFDFTENGNANNANARLPHNHNFSNIYPLGNVDIAKNGKTIQPKKLRPKKILELERRMSASERRMSASERRMSASVEDGTTNNIKSNSDSGCFSIVVMILVLLIFGISMICSGCCLFQSVEERIPERAAFSGSSIKQSSFAELKASYIEHYNLVLDELHCLEKCYQLSQEKPDWLSQKIEDHKNYLADMENYPFLCPSHDVVTTVTRGKTCPICNGKGNTFWGNTCTACSSKEKISFTSSQNKQCPYCNQLYRERILGRSLYEN